MGNASQSLLYTLRLPSGSILQELEGLLWVNRGPRDQSLLERGGIGQENVQVNIKIEAL